MNRIAAMFRMVPDTSLANVNSIVGEPGHPLDEIVMRARPNLRRLCRLHKAVAEAPYK